MAQPWLMRFAALTTSYGLWRRRYNA